MKRIRISLDDIADWHALAAAAQRAARGKRNRPEVLRFFEQYEASLRNLRDALLAARVPYGTYRAFEIHDPKRRIIHAAPFADRVAHHALMAPLTQPLDDWLVPTSYACRVGKGVHAAVHYAQRQNRRFDWYLKMDVRDYFRQIDHARLLRLLRDRFKGEGLFRLIHAVLMTYQSSPGRGLPIGALTSQHFANLYLTPADRWLIAQPEVRSHCRYMDDTVVWLDDRTAAKRLYRGYTEWIADHWGLRLKPAVIQQSRMGLSFCGYRVHRHRLRPGRRRLRQFAKRLGYWQALFKQGAIDGSTLQQNTDALLAMLQPGQCWYWRGQYLQAHPVLDV